MKVLVCGGRDYNDRSKVSRTLDALSPTVVITGGAAGADSLAQQWCAARGIPCMIFPAPWELHGRAAGHIRNGWMITYAQPNLVVAFPGGMGTANMVMQAKHHNIPVSEIE